MFQANLNPAVKLARDISSHSRFCRSTRRSSFRRSSLLRQSRTSWRVCSMSSSSSVKSGPGKTAGAEPPCSCTCASPPSQQHTIPQLSNNSQGKTAELRESYHFNFASDERVFFVNSVLFEQAFYFCFAAQILRGTAKNAFILRKAFSKVLATLRIAQNSEEKSVVAIISGVEKRHTKQPQTARTAGRSDRAGAIKRRLFLPAII